MARDLPTAMEALHGPDRSPQHPATSIPPYRRRRHRRDGLLARSRQASRVRPEAGADLPQLEPLRPRRGRRTPQAGGGLRKANNCTVRVDTMAHLQMPAKIAAEAQSQSGHDMYRTAGADPFLYENLLVSMDDVVEKIGKQGGGWYNFAAESCQTKSGWKSVPWFWISFPGTYNQAHFKKAGFEGPPKSWDELLKMGKVLKKQGNPVGIPISHCNDAHSTYWSVAWSYGAKVVEADGKTPGIVSDKTAQVIEWYKDLYANAMEPEVLSWDDAGNNRFILSGKGSWIHNPIAHTTPPSPTSSRSP